MNLYSRYKTENYSKSDKFQPLETSSLLVFGYFRKKTNYDISDIAPICLSYYGLYHSKYIYIYDYHGWFAENNELHSKCDLIKYSKDDKKIYITPFTQFIDPKYQIIYFASKGFQCVEWSGFFAINTNTFETHLLSLHFPNIEELKINNFNSTHNNVKELGEKELFNICITTPMKNLKIVPNYHSQYYGKKRIDISRRRFDARDTWYEVETEVISKESNGNNRKSSNNNNNNKSDVTVDKKIIWHDFKLHLWQMFINNRLFNMNKVGDMNKVYDMKNIRERLASYDREKAIISQPIWDVMLFFLLIYFEFEHELRLTIPGLLLEKRMHMGHMFVEHSITKKYMSGQELTKHYGFKNFDFRKDCDIKILQFDLENEKKKVFESQCYAYVDWGGGYWCIGGCKQNLYQLRFKMEKEKNGNVEMYWNVARVQSRHVAGIPMS